MYSFRYYYSSFKKSCCPQAPIIYKLIHELLCLNIAVYPNFSSASLTDCLLVEKTVQTFQTKVYENCCPNPCQSVIPCLQ